MSKSYHKILVDSVFTHCRFAPVTTAMTPLMTAIVRLRPLGLGGLGLGTLTGTVRGRLNRGIILRVRLDVFEQKFEEK